MTNQVGYIANIIIDAYKAEGHDEAYLDEKENNLKGLNKFQSLLYLAHKDSLHGYVAKTINVSVADLKTAIQVLSHC